MGIGAKGDRPEMLLQRTERGLTTKIDAQRQHIEKEPDDGLELLRSAVRDRRADHHLILPAEAM